MSLLDFIQQGFHIAGVVVSVAAPIAAITPTPTDDGVVSAARKVLDVLACNFGNAKNQD